MWHWNCEHSDVMPQLKKVLLNGGECVWMCEGVCMYTCACVCLYMFERKAKYIFEPYDDFRILCAPLI